MQTAVLVGKRRAGQNPDVITYTTAVGDLTLAQLGGFFVGWPTPPSRRQFAAVLRSSYRVVVALDSTTGRVVGFITAISDGVLTAFLPWLEVLPDYQGRGIGTQLLRRMLNELDHLYSVDLICDLGVRQFYQRRGMVPLQGMGRRNLAALDGEPQ
jgi:ribosomal protein S18 acetylase RimI-like enzyme